MLKPHAHALQRLRRHLRRRDGVHPHHRLRQHFLVGLVLVAAFGTLSFYDTSKMTKSSIRDLGHQQAAREARARIPLTTSALAVHAGETAEITVKPSADAEDGAVYFVLLSGPGRLTRPDGAVGQELTLQRAELPATIVYSPPPAGTGAPSVTVSAHCISGCRTPGDGAVAITLME